MPCNAFNLVLNLRCSVFINGYFVIIHLFLLLPKNLFYLHGARKHIPRWSSEPAYFWSRVGCLFHYASLPCYFFEGEGQKRHFCDVHENIQPGWLCFFTVVTCPEQAAPSNGQISCTKSNRFASVCRFTCDEGFRLNGKKKSNCRASGTWKKPFPTCDR